MPVIRSFAAEYDEGKALNWACGTAPPNGLYRQGWRRIAHYEQMEYACVEGEKDLQHYTTSDGAQQKPNQQ